MAGLWKMGSAPSGERPAGPVEVVVRAPWLGPRLDVLAPPKADEKADQKTDGYANGQANQKAAQRASLLRVAAMPPLDAGVARLVLVPVRHTAQGWRLTAGRWGLSRAAGRSRQWQFVHAARLVAPFISCGEVASERRKPDGWLALMLYGPGEQADLPMDLPWPGLNGAPPLVQAAAPDGHGASSSRIRQARRAIRQWMGQASAEELEACWVPRQALQRLAGHLAHPVVAPASESEAIPLTAPAEPPRRVHLAVASCQYPQGPLDGLPAQASLQHMAHHADQGRLDLALFLGDQIYADATAGLVDPTRRDERYETPHERAQRAPGLRRVLARLPSVMLLDDHELVDNWEPRPVGASPALPLWRSRVDALRDGRWGYWKYQRMRPQQRIDPARDLADKAFVFAGLPLYLADTRTGRQARSAGTPTCSAHILNSCSVETTPGQFEKLEAWLKQHRNEPKVVATPSMLLPRRAEVVSDPCAAARSDAWDGFPASLHRLLDFMLREQIRHTVFLSGDEHHALACEVQLEPASPCLRHLSPVRLTSVHSSGLHAPFPFANGHPSDLSDEPFTTPGGTRVTMKTRNAPPGDGWARVSLTPGLGDGELQVEFCKPDAGCR